VVILGLAQVRPIRDVRQNDSQGVPLLSGQQVTVTGVVTEAGHFGSSGPAFLQDSTGGCAMYDSQVESLGLGDTVTVTGTVTLFYGLTELTNLTIQVQGRVGVPEPKRFSLDQVPRIDTAAGYVENEGWLVRLDSVQIEHSPGEQFQGNTNYNLSDPSGNTGQLRIDRDAVDLVGMLIPDGYITLTGVIGQYAPNPPHFGGYQVMPRMLADLGVPSRPLLTIREVQRPGADGVTPWWLDSIVRVRGRVTGPAHAFTTGSSKSLYIQDSTQGVNVYGCRYSTSQERYFDSLGAEWEVVGKVSEYNGLTELTEGTMALTDTVRAPVLPRLLPFNSGLSEALESNLLTVVGDVISGPVRSGSGYNVVVKNGTPAITIRIDDNTGIPVSGLSVGHKVRFTGIVGQYDYDPPFTTGYQLLPRCASDVRDTTAPVGPTERLVLDTITPNPFLPAEGQVATIQVNSPRSGYRLTVAIYDLEGRLVKELLANGPGGYYDLKWDGTDELGRAQTPGIYLVSIKAACGDGTTESITRPVVLAARLR